MEHISGADLLGMRALAKEAENYVLACVAYVERLTRVHVATQAENVRLRAALEVVVAEWNRKFERAGYIAPHWVKQAREALTPNVADKRALPVQEQE